MRKILVTGFDPFGGESINPAYEAVKLLPEQILDARVIPLEVPTVFDSGPKKVIEAVSELQPDFDCASVRRADARRSRQNSSASIMRRPASRIMKGTSR